MDHPADGVQVIESSFAMQGLQIPEKVLLACGVHMEGKLHGGGEVPTENTFRFPGLPGWFIGAEMSVREFTVESENFTSQEACSEYQFPGTSTCSNPTNLVKSVSRKRAHRFLYVAVTNRQ